MRALLAALPLALLAACTTRVQSYGECMKQMPAKDAQMVAQIRVNVFVTGGIAPYDSLRPLLQAWSACCDHPGVNPDDETLCGKVRAELKRPAEGRR